MVLCIVIFVDFRHSHCYQVFGHMLHIATLVIVDLANHSGLFLFSHLLDLTPSPFVTMRSDFAPSHTHFVDILRLRKWCYLRGITAQEPGSSAHFPFSVCGGLSIRRASVYF